jgi:hypothetical protein
MFIENYRLEGSAIGGGDAGINQEVPYPRISDEDWKVWTTFLPVRTQISEHFLSDVNSRLYIQTLPSEIRAELRKASGYFDKVEVWGNRKIEKDPIAVGYQGYDRYLIARWGMAKLVPFDAMKQRRSLTLVWKYASRAAGFVGSLAAAGILVWSVLA